MITPRMVPVGEVVCAKPAQGESNRTAQSTLRITLADLNPGSDRFAKTSPQKHLCTADEA
jgi:hypothetical protein